MRLENLVWDARDPHRLGRFWAVALDAEPITDEPDGFEPRMTLAEDVFLDLCFQRVAVPSTSPARLHLDLRGGARQREAVERLLGLGAVHADIGRGEVPWVVLADPEGNAFCVMEERDVYQGTGPIAALPMDSADRDRDAGFWASVTGWIPWCGDDRCGVTAPPLRSRTAARILARTRAEPGEEPASSRRTPRGRRRRRDRAPRRDGRQTAQRAR